MKRLTCCLLILAVMFSFAFGSAAWAEGPSHFEFAAEFGTIELDLDETLWSVISRDNLKNNPLLKKLGLDPENEAKYMAENGIYADALFFYDDSDAYFEIAVKETKLKHNYNFSRLSDKMLNEVAEASLERFDGEKAGVFSNGKGLKFVYCEYKSEGIYVREYFAGMGESRLNIFFHSNEPFIDGEYQEMERIMSSLDYTPKAWAKGNLKLPSLAEILAGIGLGSDDAGETLLSRFEIETEAGTMRLKMDEAFWYVFTRENIKDNPELEEIGIDYDVQARFMEENNVRMDAIVFYEDSDAYLEMFVMEKENDKFYDDSLVSDSDYEDVAEKMAEELGFESGEMFKSNKGIRFICFELSDSGQYVKKYIFLAEDISFTIHFESNEPFIDEEYQDMETILNSFDFRPKATTKLWPND